MNSGINMKTKPKQATTRLPARKLTWCEHDVIGTFLVEHRTEFHEHIMSFGYTDSEAKLMRNHIANKIFSQMYPNQ